MAESGKNERWNSLLESLGVPASESPPPPPQPEPAAKQPSASLLPPQKSKAAPKPKAAPPAAKSPSYWSRIAGALGLDVGSTPEPVAEEPKDQRTEEPKVEPETQRRHHEPSREREMPPRAFERPRRGEERAPREERARREERPRHEERMPSEEPAGRSALDDMFGPKATDVDVFSLGGQEGPRVREPSESRTREDEERGSVLDYDVPEGSGSDLALDRPVGGEEIGREEEQRDGRRRRRRRGRGRRGRGEFREGGPPPSHEADIEPAGEEADFDLSRDEAMELEPEMGPERGLPADEPEGGLWREREEEEEHYSPSGERQPRERGGERGEERGRRGRRGRGRGRGRDRDRSSGERPAHYRGEEPQRMGSSRNEAADRQHAAEDEIDDELSAEMDEADEGRGGDVPTHKKIPTWEEAVNVLIDANMANRGPERDRGYGRGRGRGRG